MNNTVILLLIGAGAAFLWYQNKARRKRVQTMRPPMEFLVKC